MSIANKISENSKAIITSTIVVVAAALIIGGTYSITSKNKANGGEVIKSSGNNVEAVIAQWVKDNPEAIVQSIMDMQQRAVQEQQKQAQSNISSRLDDIYENPETPTSGAANYDVSVVEFFDYNCGYCKRAQQTINQLLESDAKVRVVFKEYPILSASSEELARVALAVNIHNPAKYLAFHNALMQSSARSKNDALRIAKDVVKLDVAKIEQVLSDRKDEIQSQLDANRQLGASIGVSGTPAFVIGEELISGAVGLDALKAKIAEQRKK
ncbi:MAG: DsbA family protein [Proteobacteria bacterium]|nr:DsbA family protein [Pseudomonadota bacterium]